MPQEVEDLPIVRWSEAKVAGERYYFTGRPCAHGHVARRLVSNKACIYCARNAVRENKRKLRTADAKGFREHIRRNMAGNLVGELLRRAKSHAQKKGWSFTITRDDLTIPDRCPCCGKLMRIDVEYRGKGNPSPDGPTLDRFDSGLGYIPGNVNIICSRCNLVKSASMEVELRTVANWMSHVMRQRLKLVS